MPIERREFLALAGAGLSLAVLAKSPPARAGTRFKIKAIAFDAFPVFDPRPVFALAEQLFPGKGPALGDAWRSRQFEYTWLRSLMRRYADFWQVTEEALVFAAKTLKLDLDADRRARLMGAYLELKPWPDALAALRSLKESGIRMAFLSNFTPKMLHAGIGNSGLAGLFEHALSTDAVQTFKPDPRAYRMGTEAFRLGREEILFVPFAGWDAAGAKAFGYPTFWVNRLNLPAEELGVVPDAVGKDLDDLVKFVNSIS